MRAYKYLFTYFLAAARPFSPPPPGEAEFVLPLYNLTLLGLSGATETLLVLLQQQQQQKKQKPKKHAQKI